MRYILNSEGYIEAVAFGGFITCNNNSCTEYTGSIPSGYTSLEEWNDNANVRAYKIENGNLVYDSNRDTELQALWREQEANNQSVIIEKITNNNGTAIKFSDGTMICTVDMVVTDQAINSSYVSLYQGVRDWYYPVAFIEKPVVTCGAFLWGTNSASWGSCASVYANRATLRGYDCVSRATGTSCQIQATAIGRWK